MEKEKRGKGRPKGNPFHAFNFRMDADLYEIANARKGDESLTQFINGLIREAL